MMRIKDVVAALRLCTSDKKLLSDFWNTMRAAIAPINTALTGSATYDAANLVDGAGATGTITVTGAALGDFVVGLSFGVDLQGITATGYVSAANTVSFRLQNESGGAIDLASTTVRAVVAKRDHYDGTAIFGLRA
jgi:hypothetical protein